MKISKLQIDKTGGIIVVSPEDRDDLWFLYSFITAGDVVRGRSTRKVITAGAGSRAASSTREVITTSLAVSNLEIAVDTGELRISGKNVEENEFIALGAFHTITVDLHYPITITKKDLSDHALEELKALQNTRNSPEVVAVLVQPGKALICSVKGSMTFVLSKIEESMPQKREGSERYERRLVKFYDTVAESLTRIVSSAEVKAIVIGSVAFYRNDFYNHIQNSAFAVKNDTLSRYIKGESLGSSSDNKQTKGKEKSIQSTGKRVLLVHVSRVEKNALMELLLDPEVQRHLKDTKAVGEMAALALYNETLVKTPALAQYGWKHVRAAVDAAAVSQLLVIDRLLRSPSAKVRTEINQLIKDAELTNAKVVIFSSMHASGEMLTSIGGLAAITRYEVPDIDALAEDIRSLSLLTAEEVEVADQEEETPRTEDRYGVIYDTDSDASVDSDASYMGGVGLPRLLSFV